MPVSVSCIRFGQKASRRPARSVPEGRRWLYLFGTAGLCAGVACVPERKGPVASFEVYPKPEELTVTFNASASKPGRIPTVPGEALEYLWDFGDQNSWSCVGSGCKCDECRGHDPEVKHPYASAGRYRVVLTVKDLNNSTDSSSTPTNLASPLIHAGNKRPVARFEWSPSDPTPEDLVTFDGSGSTDDEGVRKWCFTVLGAESCSESPIFSRKFDKEGDGDYDVALAAEDTDKASSATSFVKTTRVRSRPVVKITSLYDNEPVCGPRVPIDVSDEGGVVPNADASRILPQPAGPIREGHLRVELFRSFVSRGR